MPISYVGGKVAGTAGQGGGSISLTTGWSGGSGGNPLAGDLVVVTVSVGTAARQPTIAIATPSGYTALTAQRTTATTYDTNVQTCYKVMGSTPDTAVTIPASGNIADGIAYAIQVFRGVDTTTPMDVTPTYATGTAVSNRPDPAAITPVSAGAWVVCCGGGASATGTTLYTAAALTGFRTANGADTNDGTVGVGYYTGWTSGAYNPAGFLGGSTVTTSSWGATTLALRPGPNLIGIAPAASITSATAALTTVPVGAELVDSQTGTDTITTASWVQAGDLAICMAFRDGSATPPGVPADELGTAVARTLPSSASWYGVAYGNGTYVAVAQNTTAAASSSDGITWTARTMPSAANWVNVAFCNGLFVAVGYGSAAAATSTDGITWTARTLPTSSSWRSVTYGGGVFIAVALGTAAASSSDGITWTALTLPAGSWASVTYGNGVFVAVADGPSTIAASSADGIIWTSRTLPSNSNWQSVTYGNGVFVAVALSTTAAASSTDGVTWSARTMPSSPQWASVAYGQGQFVAVAYNSAVFASSPDGQTWGSNSMPASGYWQSVAYGEVFVAVASVSGAVSATIPVTTPPTTLDSSGSGTSSSVLAYKTLTASGTQTIGPFTNATCVACNVYRNVDPTAPIGAYAVNSGTGTTVTLPAVTTAPDSFAVGFAGHQSVNVAFPASATGVIRRAQQIDATDAIVVYDTAGPAS